MPARAATPPPPAKLGSISPAIRSAFSPRWMVVLLFAATFLAYLPSYSGAFLWDDDGHVTKPELRSLDGLVRIWTEPAATQQYYPLLHSAFWLEHKLWGDHPLGYRLLNVLLHATAACLFAALLRRLAIPGAWLAAFVFALHPVCVESVAWISEQKNTLSLVLYLAAALAYLRFDDTWELGRPRPPRAYALATALFACALLTKSVTATLPAALLVIFWWQRGWPGWRRNVLPLLPWLALGIGAGCVTSWVEHHLIGAHGPDYALSALQRCLLAGRIAWFYFGKLLWPTGLLFIYPRWTIDPAAFLTYLYPLGVLAIAGALSLWARQHTHRGPLACFLLFVGTLIPALGFINVYPFTFSYVADHFQYHACLAVIALATAGLWLTFSKLPGWAARLLVVVIVATLGGLTARQSRAYASNLVLFQNTLATNPAAAMAHINIARIFTSLNRHAEAMVHLEKALELRPFDHEIENNLGTSLTSLGRAPEALPHLQRAVTLQPTFFEGFNSLGITCIALRKNADAISAFERSLQLKPDSAIARFNLGLATAHTGRTADAIAHFQTALQLDPDYADAELHWGINLFLLKRFPEAVPHFERAIALKPASASYREMFGRALANTGRTQDAITRYREALEIDPNHADAHFNLSLALREIGRLEEAAAHRAEAARLKAATDRDR